MSRWALPSIVLLACSGPAASPEHVTPSESWVARDEAAAARTPAGHTAARAEAVQADGADAAGLRAASSGARGRTATAGGRAAETSSPSPLAEHPSLLLRTIAASRGLGFLSTRRQTVMVREDAAGVTMCRRPLRLGCERVARARLAPRPWLRLGGEGQILVPILLGERARLLVAPGRGAPWILDDPIAPLVPSERLASPLAPDVASDDRRHEALDALEAHLREGPASGVDRPVAVEEPTWARLLRRRALEGYRVALLAREGERRLVAVERERATDEHAYVRLVARDALGTWRSTPRLAGRVRSGAMADDWEPGALFVAFEPVSTEGSALDIPYAQRFELLALRVGERSLERAGALPIGESGFIRDSGERSRVWRWWYEVSVPGRHRVELRLAYAYGAVFDRRSGRLSDERAFSAPTRPRGYAELPPPPRRAGVHRWAGGRFVARETPPR